MTALPGALLLLALFVGGWWISRRLAPSDPGGLHAARALAFGYALGLVWTDATLGLGVYGWVAAVLTALPVLGLCRSVAGEIRPWLDDMVTTVLGWPRILQGVLAWWTVTLGFGVLRLATEALPGWDPLTYHLVHAGRWVRDGRIVRDPAPDAWTYYEWYVTGGDNLWSWFMLGDGTSDHLWLPSVLVYAAAAAVVIQAARTVGHAEESAAAAGLAAVCVPALMVWVDDAMVDVHVVLFSALVVTFGTRAMRDGRMADLLAVGAAVAVTVAVKDSALLWVPFLLLVPFASRLPTWRELLAVALPLALLVPRWGERLLVHGNPVYPVGIPIFGGGNELLGAIMDCEAPDCTRRDVWIKIVWMLLMPPPASYGLLAGWLLLPAGVIGLIRRVREDWRAVAALAVVALPLPWVLFNPSTGGMVAGWHIGRLVISGWMALALAAPWASKDGSAGRVVGIVALLGIVATFPGELLLRYLGRGPAFPDLSVAFLVLFGATLAVAAGGVALAVRDRRFPLGLVVGTLFALALVTPRVRAPIADFDPAVPYSRDEAEAWRYLRDRPAGRVDVQAAFVEPGQNVFRFPLMGRTSQHRLTHVSPWRSGAHRGEATEPPPDDTLDPAAWRSRLEREGVTHVFVQGHPRVRALADADPDLVPVAGGEAAMLYELRHTGVAAP